MLEQLRSLFQTLLELFSVNVVIFVIIGIALVFMGSEMITKTTNVETMVAFPTPTL